MKKASHRFFRAGIVPFLLIFLLGGLLPVKPAAAQTPTILSIDPISTDLLVGEVATVSVRVQDVINLTAEDIQLNFDPDVLEVLDKDPLRDGVQIDTGGFLQPGNESINRVDNLAGTIRYAISQVYPDPPKSGSGLLFTFQVRAKSAKLSSQIHFDQDSTPSKSFPVLVTSSGGIMFTTADGVVNVRQPGDLSLTKTDGLASIEAGKSLSYTITVTNPGANAVSGAVVTDTLPAALESPAWTCAASAGSTCAASGSGNLADTVNLAVAGTVTYTLTATVNAAMTGTLSNTAAVALPSTYVETDPTNNTATDVTDVVPPVVEPISADMSLTKTDGLESIRAGRPLTYTITVSNLGSNAVTGATVTDTLPVGLESAAWTCAASAGSACAASGTGNLADTVNLAAGGTVTYTLHATVRKSMTGVLTNTASVALPAGYEDPVLTNNAATDTTQVLPPMQYIYIPLVLK